MPEGKKKTEKVKYPFKCWEYRKCDEKECPAYGRDDEYCWLITGTLCRDEVSGTFHSKLSGCMDCEVFTKNMEAGLWETTIGRLDRDIKEHVMKMEEWIALSDVKERMVTSSLKETEELSRGLADVLKELEEAKAYTDNIIESMIDSLIVVDSDGIIRSVNSATLDLLGYKEELIGQPSGKIFEEKILFKETGLKRLIEEGSIKNYAMTYKTRTGEKIPVDFSGSVMRDGKGELIGIVGIARDVRQTRQLISDLEKAKTEFEELSKTLEKKVQERTEDLTQSREEAVKAREILVSMLDDNNRIREELERKLQELKQAEAMLIQSEKLASLGKLVADMAHEVNNPLMIISGRAQISMLKGMGSKDFKESCKIIMDQCQRARDVIQRLLLFSKPSKGEVKEVNINDAIDFIVEIMEHQYSLINIRIVKKYRRTLPLLKVDERQIHEVLMNLFKNSADAMPGGGTITVATAVEDNNVRIDVTDTGIGISGKDIGRIFDPFFTTKESGTGLGLSVCYGIIKVYGGDMKCAGSPGEGTTMTILLPVEGK